MTVASEFKPQYLPKLVDEKAPVIIDGVLETLAFVLSGIDPIEQSNTTRTQMDLRQVVIDPSVRRVGPSVALRQDYQFILNPLFDFTKTDFDELWQDAKEIPFGQEATEFLKLAKQLRRLDIDSDGTELSSSKNSMVVQQIRENSHRLLHKIHRTAVRHIEEKLKTPTPVPTPPWYVSALNRMGFGKGISHATVYISAEIQSEVSRYLEDTMKLGRVLRANARRA